MQVAAEFGGRVLMPRAIGKKDRVAKSWNCQSSCEPGELFLKVVVIPAGLFLFVVTPDSWSDGCPAPTLGFARRNGLIFPFHRNMGNSRLPVPVAHHFFHEIVFSKLLPLLGGQSPENDLDAAGHF